MQIERGVPRSYTTQSTTTSSNPRAGEPDVPLPHAAVPPPLLPPGRGARITAASSEDVLIKGRGAADGCRMESMAYLFVQARNTLFEGDGMSGATVDAGEGQLFCTRPGRLLSVSERDTRRARALVEEEVEKTDIKRKKQRNRLTTYLMQTANREKWTFHLEIRLAFIFFSVETRLNVATIAGKRTGGVRNSTMPQCSKLDQDKRSCWAMIQSRRQELF